ncbi:hypothetical protein [Ottowia sp.]|uniref:hypothetical protein n=1 Tax=Ottowia sp. TaxID=1898956 RepID=UPI0025EBBEA5|nr:hypothetical protein [Ottowia sp.]MBK6616288.1 hypothetical protein [Ottowia sp.]
MKEENRSSGVLITLLTFLVAVVSVVGSFLHEHRIALEATLPQQSHDLGVYQSAFVVVAGLLMVAAGLELAGERLGGTVLGVWIRAAIARFQLQAATVVGGPQALLVSAELADFYARLEQHDWHCAGDAPDDSERLERNVREYEELLRMARQSKAHQELLDAFAAHEFSGEAWHQHRQRQPKPVLLGQPVASGTAAAEAS